MKMLKSAFVCRTLGVFASVMVLVASAAAADLTYEVHRVSTAGWSIG